MTTNITDHSNVRERLRELGCHEPHGFTILPWNFEDEDSIDEFIHLAEAATVKTLLRSANLPYDDIVDRDKRPSYLHMRSYDWIGPTIFVPAVLISENSAFVSVALSVIANYLTDLFKGMRKTSNVRLNIVVEESSEKSCKKISYEGPVEGLQSLVDAVEKIKDA